MGEHFVLSWTQFESQANGELDVYWFFVVPMLVLPFSAGESASRAFQLFFCTSTPNWIYFGDFSQRHTLIYFNLWWLLIKCLEFILLYNDERNFFTNACSVFLYLNAASDLRYKTKTAEGESILFQSSAMRVKILYNKRQRREHWVTVFSVEFQSRLRTLWMISLNLKQNNFEK